jgi:RsiW-degrading membrane proteinase PrsW (M82 family)
MEPSPQKKKLVRHLSLALYASYSGIVLCIAGLAAFGDDYRWVESQRVHPTLNPVFYAGAVESLHSAYFLIIPLLGVLFLLTTIFIWLVWRDSKKFD